MRALRFGGGLVRRIQGLVDEHGLGGEAIFPVLGAIRDEHGRLTDQDLEAAARILGVRFADLRHLAIQSGLLAIRGAPAHTVAVCIDKTCRRLGSPRLLEAIRRRTGLAPGEASPTVRLRVEAVPCLGACELGPNALLDGACCHRLTPSGLTRLLRGLVASPPVS